ncbi:MULTISPECIES: 2-dehydropantoate 2-reductase N-terminal domain-containing protein [unclassified Pseudonocardia]|uniref:ketopantoate reductase family protein n=1 Tax=unclassified Pseudonocardia TaxID=2619320 RepID=UPI0001FFEAF8|nr:MULTISPECIES: 2-dehydropantoate 2-reductase N-terminal domain-containing protein [unclassified Pseudonocardia]ALE75603.1 2-dehydropantoate 2-reductase [Pseudonocardia sp. EC080625-04]ALL74981.1 2-dehydropantoate 2-reductase [Pseudonocardia sp. EC080610-09]ALL82003.1 2-dehydropantoate 2-reductase [Pseudonocardia sp. EC080619-01]OLM21396.1 2-dehydropantoate 2-reductase [Pseudonocardia sp. Ae707_Ps1]
MRYVVIGAGAVGGTIGARLDGAGRDVVLVARGAHLDAIRERGLRLDSPDGSRTHRIPAVASVTEVDWADGDVAVLAVKSQDTGPVLTSLAAVAPDVTIACAQNGVANERAAAERFDRVQAVLVILPVEHYEPGVVIASSSPVPGVLDVGTYPAGTDDASAALSADLRAAGFASRPDPAVMDAKYGKLLTNLGNAVDAICGTADPDAARVTAAATAEGEACLAAAGITARTGDDDRVRREGILTEQAVGGRSRRGSSSWQSLSRGSGSIEARYLNGEIVALGAAHGVPTPVNAELLRVAEEMAASGEAPASRRGATLLTVLA